MLSGLKNRWMEIPLHLYKQEADLWGIYQARATKKRHRAEDAAGYTV